jgi:DNA repair exonuclease SbcCD ATPase subunit
MKIKLQNLYIQNFKGIPEFNIVAAGENLSITGQNASGKTTVADAFSWCLFGKDSNGQAQFSIKPLDEAGQDIHNLETVVEAILSIDGRDMSLRKRFEEKYTKARGSAKKEFQGHTTDHFIDGVPLKKKDYDARVADLFSLEQFNLVTNPAAFNALHWTKRREILLSMCDTVQPDDVAGSDKDLKPFLDKLNGSSLDDFKARLKSQQKEINDELKEIPVRIQEHQNTLQSAKAPDQAKKKSLDYNLKEAREKLRQIENNERLSALQVRRNEINAAILEKQSAAGPGIEEQRKPIREQIEKKGQQLRDVKNRIQSLQDEITRDENRNRLSREALETMRTEWQQIKAREYDGSESCPTCGQDLPAEKIADAVAKFNQDKARDLKQNEEKGREIAAGTTGRQNAIDAAKAKIGDQQKIADRLKKEIDRLDQEYADVQPVAVDTREMDQELVNVDAEIEAIKSGSGIQGRDIKAKIEKLEIEIEYWNQADADYRSAQKSGDRVKELEAQEKKLAAAYETLEADLFLAERFTVRQAEMIEDKANELFSLVKWKLFDNQINGGVSETCVATYRGVPYPDLNTGARVQVGLDIINTLSRHYDLVAPVWLDNRESVTWLPEIDAQVISMKVVDRRDKDFNKIDGLFIENEDEQHA